LIVGKVWVIMNENFKKIGEQMIYAILFPSIIGFLVVLSVVLFLTIHIKSVIKAQNEKVRNNIFKGEFIYYKNFEMNWITSRYGNKGVSGYKCNDTSGCYVILIFGNIVENEKYDNFDNVYIGQSINICKRVHSHFTGKGKGDIYADIKYGKEAYVQFIPSPIEDMNKLEKELIRSFNAQTSYNNTRGGGIVRSN